jgi:hippurate hydrolase
VYAGVAVVDHFDCCERPSCYLFIGNGDGEGGCMVHEPNYDFNDEIIPIGATLFARLVEAYLPVG